MFTSVSVCVCGMERKNVIPHAVIMCVFVYARQNMCLCTVADVYVCIDVIERENIISQEVIMCVYVYARQNMCLCTEEELYVCVCVCVCLTNEDMRCANYNRERSQTHR